MGASQGSRYSLGPFYALGTLLKFVKQTIERIYDANQKLRLLRIIRVARLSWLIIEQSSPVRTLWLVWILCVFWSSTKGKSKSPIAVTTVDVIEINQRQQYTSWDVKVPGGSGAGPAIKECGVNVEQRACLFFFNYNLQGELDEI